MDVNELLLLSAVFVLFCLMPYVVPETGAESGNPAINGLFFLHDYTLRFFLPALIPGFLIAAGLLVFLPKGDIIKHLERKRPISRTYAWSIVSGFLLSVYPFTILPLLNAIKKKKIETGPMMSFIYTVSALNVISIVLTAAVLGLDLSIARIFFSIVFSLVIGVIVGGAFEEEGRSRYKGLFDYFEDVKEESGLHEIDDLPTHEPISLGLFFANLAAIILVALIDLDILAKLFFIVLLVLLLWNHMRRNFTTQERNKWLDESYIIARTTMPFLWAGVFLIGMFSAFFPFFALFPYLGSGNVLANFFAVVLGMLLYFPIILEVPVAKALLDLGVNRGAVLAFILAAPVASPPTIILLRKMLGKEKTIAYAGLVAVFAITAGLIYGAI